MFSNKPRIVKSAYSSLNAEVPLNIKAVAKVAGSAVAGSETYLTFTPDPTQPTDTTTALKVPPDEAWIIFDVYTPVQTPAIDGYVAFRVNKKDQNITFGPLSATYKNTYGYLELQSAISADPNSEVQSKYVIDVANGATTATTVSVNIRIKRVPKGYTGQLSL
jgi:hypothetical protein